MPDSTLLLLTAVALTAGGICMMRCQNSQIEPVVDKPMQEIVFKPPPAPAVPVFSIFSQIGICCSEWINHHLSQTTISKLRPLVIYSQE